MHILKGIWDNIVRWRTWLVNAFAALLIVMPDLLNSPELIAVIPQSYQKWVLLAALLVNIWMRPRPAVLPKEASK